MSYAKDFATTKDHGRTAYEAWGAVWNPEDGHEIAIACPTLEKLQQAWLGITGLDLIDNRAQHAFFIKAES